MKYHNIFIIVNIFCKTLQEINKKRLFIIYAQIKLLGQTKDFETRQMIGRKTDIPELSYLNEGSFIININIANTDIIHSKRNWPKFLSRENNKTRGSF